MKNLYKIILLLVFCAVSGKAFSQTYQEKDANGEKVYYILMSAAPQYVQKCLEDNIRNAQYSNYSFLINDSSNTNLYQQWQLIPATISGYYIKNRRSLRYMKIDDTNWVGRYLCPSYVGTKYGASIFDFISIGNNQVIIRYTDSGGDLRYLNAVDSTSDEINVVNLSEIQNTVNAWTVLNGDGTPTGIKPLTTNENISITVKNHKIVVIGCDKYNIFDLQGRLVNAREYIISGTYIIVVKGKPYKVMVS